ncbi:Mediator-associated protein 1 [Spatholobus suberectus]|nr:Mediator-associated protein 1 [Spatholobus suberectus]
MAQKQKQQRPFPIDDPPTASSSEYEEDEDQQPSSQQRKEEVSSEEEEEEVSSQEDHDDQPSSLPPAATNPRPKPSSSESDTDTDSEPEPTKVKPKPVDPAQKPKPQPTPAPPRSGSKRVAENNVQPKRAKKKPTDASSSAAAAVASDEETEEDGKKSGGHTKLFQRLWSEEDELAILKGMAEFTSKTGQDPYKYADSFHDFVKKSLHVEASSNQLKEKIRRLKKKFETNAGRGKNGEGPRLYKPHDQTVFELSKRFGEELMGRWKRPSLLGKLPRLQRRKLLAGMWQNLNRNRKRSRWSLKSLKSMIVVM